MAANSGSRPFLELADLLDEDALQGAAMESINWLGLVWQYF